MYRGKIKRLKNILAKRCKAGRTTNVNNSSKRLIIALIFIVATNANNPQLSTLLYLLYSMAMVVTMSRRINFG